VTGTYEIWTVQPDGTGMRQLTTCRSAEVSFGCVEPRWSPDGRRIVYAEVEPTSARILVMNADGSDQHVIFTAPPEGYAFDPTWSPDGTHIAFTLKDPETGDDDIWTMNAAGGELRRLTDSPEGDGEAAWSPDGSAIAFETHRTGNGEIFLMNPDGSNPRQITEEAADDFRPSWSPDGTHIAFASQRHSGVGRSSIWVMRADGADPVEVAYAPGRIDHYPAFSPDGTRIAYMSATAINGEEIWTVNADGTDPRQLTFNAGKTDENPDWQPLPVTPSLPLGPPAGATPGPAVTPKAKARPGALDVPRFAWVGRGSRLLRLTVGCSGDEACDGVLRLRAGGRGIGAHHYRVAPGGVRTVTVVISRRARRALDRRGSLVARVRADGPARRLVLRSRGRPGR
jgi:TolB protein